MYKIIEKRYDFYKKLLSTLTVKMVCSEEEAIRLLEVCYRSDSFTVYCIVKVE